MATTTHVPVEVYLRSSYEPDAEYVDGEIEESPMGEFDHTSWQQAIQIWFWQHEKGMGYSRACRSYGFGSLRRGIAFPMSRCLTAADPSSRSSRTRRSPCLRFCLPEDRLQRMKRKLEDYRAMGIPEIWVIDPQDSTFYRYEELQLLRKDTFSHAEKGSSST